MGERGRVLLPIAAVKVLHLQLRARVVVQAPSIHINSIWIATRDIKLQ